MGIVTVIALLGGGVLHVAIPNRARRNAITAGAKLVLLRRKTAGAIVPWVSPGTRAIRQWHARSNARTAGN